MCYIVYTFRLASDNIYYNHLTDLNTWLCRWRYYQYGSRRALTGAKQIPQACQKPVLYAGLEYR